MEIIAAVYGFFAHATPGSVPNHLAHCVLSAAIQAVLILLLSPLMGVRRAALIGAVAASAFYIGRSQAQTEWLWTGAQWYVSWAFWRWPMDQFYGSVFPVVSTSLTYFLTAFATSRRG